MFAGGTFSVGGYFREKLCVCWMEIAMNSNMWECHSELAMEKWNLPLNGVRSSNRTFALSKVFDGNRRKPFANNSRKPREVENISTPKIISWYVLCYHWSCSFLFQYICVVVGPIFAPLSKYLLTALRLHLSMIPESLRDRDAALARLITQPPIPLISLLRAPTI